MPQSIPRGLTPECVLKALAELDASEQFIEVKTTGLGKHFPF